MPPPPFVICVCAAAKSTLDSSRFGPTVPVAPASESVWQLPQPVEAKTSLPAAGSPSVAPPPSSLPVGTSPITVSGVGVASSAPPQPCDDESGESENECGDAGHGPRSIPAVAAANPVVPTSRTSVGESLTTMETAIAAAKASGTASSASGSGRRRIRTTRNAKAASRTRTNRPVHQDEVARSQESSMRSTRSPPSPSGPSSSAR